jgi:translocation and assembly module TamB
LLGSPVLRDITLRDEQDVVVGRIAELRLNYNLRALLNKRLEIQTAEVIQLELTLVQAADGRLNLIDLLSSSSSEPGAGGLPFAIVIDNLYIRQGHLTLQLPALSGVQHLEDLEAHLSAQLGESGFAMQMQQATAHATPADVAIRALQGVLQTHDGVVQVDDLRLQTAQSTVTASGTLPDASQEAHLTLHMQPLDLAEVGRLQDNPALHGQVRLALQADGPLEALQVQSELSALAGRMTVQGQINSIATPPRYRGTLDVTHLDLAALLRQTPHSNLNMQLTVDGAGVALQELHTTVRLELSSSHLGDIVLHPSHIQLEIADQRVQIHRLALHTSLARTTASGVFALNGATDVQYTLNADLSELQRLVSITDLAGHIQTQGQVNGTWPDLKGHGMLEANDLRYANNTLESLRLTYDGSQLGSQPQITAQLLARQARVGPLPIAQVVLDATYQGREKQTRFAIEVVQSPGSGGQAQGTLTQDAAGQQVVLEELQVRLSERTWQAVAPLQVAFGPQRLEVTQFHLVHNEESLVLSGAVHGDQLQDIHLRATQLDLSYWHQLLPLSDLMHGRLTLDAQLTGTRIEPDLQAALTLQSPAAPPLPFTQLHSRLVYAQRQLQSTWRVHQDNRDVLMLEARLPIDLALTDVPLAQRLRQGPVAIRIRLEQPHLAALHQWQPALPQLTGTLQGTLNLQGTYATLDLDASAQLQQLGIEGMVAQMRAPVHLHSTLVTAPSFAALVQGLTQRQMTLQMPTLVLRIPTLEGRVLGSDQRASAGSTRPTPGDAEAGEPVEVHNLLLQASAQWTGNGPQATLEHLGFQVSGFELPRIDVQLAAQWTPQSLNLTRLHLRSAQSELRVQGSLTQPEQQVQLRLDVLRLDLAHLPFTLPPTLPRLVQGVLSVHGHLSAPQVEAHLQYAGGQIDAALSAQLQERLPRYQATLRLDGLDLAQVLPPAQGRLQARAQLQGTGVTEEQRRVTLAMTVETAGFTLAPGLAAQLRATLAGSALQLQRLNVHSAAAALTASGTLSTARQAALQYHLTLGDLTSLQPLLSAPLQASGSLTGTLQGPLSALRTRGQLQLEAWRVAEVRGQRLQATFTADQISSALQATLRAQLRHVQGPSLPPSSLSVEGTYASQQGTLTVAVTEGPYQRTRLVGQVDLTTGQRLTLKTLRVQHQELVWENTAPVEIARNPEGTVHIQRFRLRSGPQTIRVQGTLEPQGAVRAEVRVMDLRLRSTARAFAPDLSMPDGRLALAMSLSGTRAQPQVQGTIQLTALQWQEQQLGHIQATFGLSDATWQTALRWQVQGDEIMQAYGTVRLGAARALDLRLQAPAVNLALLAPLMPAVTQSAGILSLDLQVTGALQQPQVYGALSLRDGVLQLAATGERYQDIEARLTFAGDRITLNQVQIGSRSGSLQLTGWLAHTGLTLRQVDIALDAHNFTAMRTSTIDAVVSAQMTVRGSQQELTVLGSLTVPRAHLRVDRLPGTGPAPVQPWELTVAGVYGPGPKAPGNGTASSPTPAPRLMLLSALRANIQVDLPRNIWLQGAGTAIEISGNLQITKERGEPVILSGSLETVRGFASYYGKQFTLERGLVTFTGTPEIVPRLDVIVTKEITDYVVSIHVTGTAQQPEITFSSTPELPQADILSLLVLGKPINQLTQTEHTSLVNEAQQLVGGLVASQLERVLAPALGLQTVEITAGEQVGTGSVQVGRYVTDDLFLTLEQEFGTEESATTLGLEYSITRRLKARASSSNQGETGLDLLWRLDY